MSLSPDLLLQDGAAGAHCPELQGSKAQIYKYHSIPVAS